MTRIAWRGVYANGGWVSSVSEIFFIILYCGKRLAVKKICAGRQNIRNWRAIFRILPWVNIGGGTFWIEKFVRANGIAWQGWPTTNYGAWRITPPWATKPLTPHNCNMFCRVRPVCRDGGIGRRSGLKIRRGQPLASSSLAPGTKLNQGFVKMAQGRSQTLFCVFLSFIPLLSRPSQVCFVYSSAGLRTILLTK